MLGKAISIASKAFEDKKDKGGNPYILHCLYVMNKVKHLGEHYMVVGVLHDLLEDTSWTEKDLLEEGFSFEVVYAMLAITHEKDETYEEYIKKISNNKIAKAVKIEDLKHNSDITRMKGLRKKDFDRLEKYHRAYTYLKD